MAAPRAPSGHMQFASFLFRQTPHRAAWDRGGLSAEARNLALAEAEGAVFVTADERLVNALMNTPMAPLLHWIGGPETD